MVFYELVVTTKPHTPFWKLTDIAKAVTYEVVNSGGLVRGIHNHGVRDINVRIKAKHTDQLGRRYYENGRYFSVYMDCNPRTRDGIRNMLSLDEDILRHTTLKARCILDPVNALKEKDNPYLRRLNFQAKLEERAQRTAEEEPSEKQSLTSSEE